MLSSIHPLGERGRNNRWGLTVGAFVAGAVIVAGAIGAALGLIGGLVAPFSSLAVSAGATAGAGVAAAALDWRRIVPPGPKRQVNERWIGAYRGWVYGLAFGAQLGAGGATYIVTWLVYAAALAAVFSGSPADGVLVGLVFGAGRAAPVVAAKWIDRPSRLGAFHKRMAALGPVVRVASITVAAVASVAVFGAAIA